MCPIVLRGAGRGAVAWGVARAWPALLFVITALTVLLAAAPVQAAPSPAPSAFTSGLPDFSSLAAGPPASLALPVVTGPAVRGATLTVSSGRWSPSATSVTYQWQTDSGSSGATFTDITGATTTTYTLTAGDVGSTLRVHVVATNAQGSALADSVAAGPVIAATPVNTTAPVLSGSTVGGRALSVTAGSWYPAGTSYAYQWQRSSSATFADIAAATNPTYTTTPADVGHTLRVRVTATNPYGSATVQSAATATITTGVPVNTAVPVISGIAKRGRSLAANAGTWSPAATSYAYQWQSDDGSGFADISGATGTGYTPVAGDLGLPLRVVVSATNAFGTVTAVTAATAVVTTDPPVNVGSPSIAGTPKRTFTLTASAGTWTPSGATFTYQWQRNTSSGFAAIASATAAAYTLVTADVGTTVRVVVTAHNADGTASATSAQTATVVAATPGSTTVPAISNGMRVGDALSTSDGAWSPAAASYAYQWQRRVAGIWTDIAGATSRTYTLAAADTGTVLRSKVVATNADGTGTSYSGASLTIVAPPVPPATIAAPTGTLVDTNTLTIAPGAWSPSSTTFTYQWLRCPSGATVIGGCVTIGAGQSYALSGEDVGHTIAARVTGTASGVSVVRTATLTANVAGRALTLTTAPVIAGTVQVMQSVRAVPAIWSVPTRTVRYQWQRCDVDGTHCTDILGATGQRYKITVADSEHALVVHEAATSWGRASTADSAAAVVVDQPLPSATTLPRITGVTARNANLQAARGDWANDPTSFAYAWQRCDAAGTHCTPIPGASHANYVLTVADVGSTITIAVTATNTAGSVVAQATPTSVVAAVLPELAAIGAITGKLQVPQMIQAQRSTWHTSSDTRYAYQWQRCDGDGAHCSDIAGAHTQTYRLQTADARARLRIVNVATNADGSTTAITPVTAAIAPAAPGLQRPPRLTVTGRPEAGKTATLTSGSWSATTEITTKVLRFWRCNPRCTALATAGAGSYTLTDDDAGALIRGSETATGPGGTLTAWSAAWLGPVHSSQSASSSFAASGGSALLRTATGVALARATVSSAAALASSAALGHGAMAAAVRDRTVRITLRRVAGGAKGRLRAWACLANPSPGERVPCSRAMSLHARGTLKLAVNLRQRVRVVVVRVRPHSR
jgi:hypothetical protein